MKKTYKILVVSSLLLTTTFVGCEKSASDPAQTDTARTFLLSAGSESASRTQLEGVVIRWSSADQVGVFSEKTQNARFDNTSTAASASAVFRGTLESAAAQVTAYYPYDAAVTLSSGSLRMVLPREQRFVSNDTFADRLNPSVASGEISQPLVFRNCCGVIKVRLKGNVSVSSIEFIPANGAVSGAATIAAGTATVRPTVAMTGTQGTSVLLTQINQALDMAVEKTYYLVLPPAAYNGFTLRVTDMQKHVVEAVSTKSLTVKQAVVTTIGVVEVNPQVTLTPSFGQENFTEESWSWE